MAFKALAGTQRTLPDQAEVVGNPDPDAVIRVTVDVKPSRDSAGEHLRTFAIELGRNEVNRRAHLTRDDFAMRFGAVSADLQKVRRFAREHGLLVVRDRVVEETHASKLGHSTVELKGTVRAFNKAFGVRMVRVRDSNGVTYRSFNGSIAVPEEYEDVIRNVFGFDTRPQVKPRVRFLPHLGGYDTASSSTGYTPIQIAKLYNFPAHVTGAGQTVAIIELGGGARRRDLRAYFDSLGIKMPSVAFYGIGRGKNAPTGHPNSADGEVMLDIEVCGAIAHGAKYIIYFAPNTNRGFFRAVKAAIHDNLNRPSIISISWGGPEATWTLSDMSSIDSAFQAAAAMGISVFCAAGDAGSTDGVPGSLAHVDFPASSPFVTACGGTRLSATADGASVLNEIVWNGGPNDGTGGGISSVFVGDLPTYQTGPFINVPPSVNPGGTRGRGIPDVSGNADPITGYKIRVDGRNMVVGGTSAVAPLWAALFALINEDVGQPVGFANPLLYSVVNARMGALRDITQGNNDTTGLVHAYQASQGWDPCSGLGSPSDATQILEAIKSTA